jgi:hypothetical protein
MLQTERIADTEESVRSALDNLSKNTWTMMPGIIQTYDAATQTAVVQIATKMQTTDSSGNISWISIAPLPDVPVVYYGGGIGVLTFPIQQGDECEVHFADRCIDGWWQQGGVQNQVTIRFHDLSDGFALIGPRSQANLIPNVSTTTIQLRTLDQTVIIEIDPAGVITLTAQQVTIQANQTTINSQVQINGNLAVSGMVTATGEGTFGPTQIPVTQHIHPGVQGGPSNTAPPIP